VDRQLETGIGSPSLPRPEYGLFASEANWWSRCTVDDYGNEVGPGWPEIRLSRVTSDSEIAARTSSGLTGRTGADNG